jgi:hypothetical protein
MHEISGLLIGRNAVAAMRDSTDCYATNCKEGLENQWSFAFRLK